MSMKDQVGQALETIPEWKRNGEEIERVYEFDGFPPAVQFVNKVAESAERANHHPDIDIRWNKVRLVLSTHSEGKLTLKDVELAREIDAGFSEER